MPRILCIPIALTQLRFMTRTLQTLCFAIIFGLALKTLLSCLQTSPLTSRARMRAISLRPSLRKWWASVSTECSSLVQTLSTNKTLSLRQILTGYIHGWLTSAWEETLTTWSMLTEQRLRVCSPTRVWISMWISVKTTNFAAVNRLNIWFNTTWRTLFLENKQSSDSPKMVD